MQQSLPSLLKRLWHHVNSRRRVQFFIVLFLTLLSSFAEVISLGAVMPFIGVLTQPEKLYASPRLAGFIHLWEIGSPSDLVLPFSIIFASAALVAGGLRLLLLFASIRLANAIGADLSIDIYRRTLYQTYIKHISRSSSEIISGITHKVGSTVSVLISMVTVITSAGLFIAIIFTLVALNPVVALVAATSFAIAYGLVAQLTRPRLIRNGQCISQGQTQVIKALQEGLGAIRDVLLDGTQKIYCGVYRKAILELQHASGENTFISQAPRYVMEALGMALISIFVLALSHRSGGILAALPLLAILALGAQRILPLMQQLYGNWSVVVGSRTALADVLALLDQPLPSYLSLPEPAPYPFKKSIFFDGVGFSYDNNLYVLDDVNLSVPKGSRVGIIGATGSGKSTMLDLLMGLLEPTSGCLLVDGEVIKSNSNRAWQRAIAHVPQSIFLADATIAENIAFGVPLNEIDMVRVRKVAAQARIAEFIESRPVGYEAMVGERGVRLSGGQRQRIGIARALYKQASILVFDEATSALDSETERSVMKAIEALSKDLTLFIVAHRLTTLSNCDFIVKLEGGKILERGTYNHFISNFRAQ